MNAESSLEDRNTLLHLIDVLPPKQSIFQTRTLNDGFRIWEILGQVDPAFFVGELPEIQDISKWVSRSQNLKYIGRQIERWMTNHEFSMPIGLHLGSIDTKRAATGDAASELEIAKLLKLVLYTILKSPKLPEYVQIMLSFSAEEGDSLMAICKALESDPDLSSPDEVDHHDDDAGSGTDAPEMDRVLYLEEQLSKAMTERETLSRDKYDLQRALRELDNRHSRLQENNEILQQKIINLEDDLEHSQTQRLEEPNIRRLESRIQQQDDIIASQESQLSELQETYDGLGKESMRLRKENEKLQPLQDELDEIRVQRDQLAKRANAADKYKQKLQDSADLEKENQLLRGELEELRFEKGDGSNARSEIAGLQRTLDEYKNLLPAIERERHELQMMLKQYERDNADLEQEIYSTKEQLMKSQDEITELRSGAPLSPIDQASEGLAHEIENGERMEALESLSPEERSRQLSKLVDETRAEVFMHKQVLENEKTKYSQLEQRFEALHAEKLALERRARGSDSVQDESALSLSDETVGNRNLENGGSNLLMESTEAEVSKLKERIKFMESQNPGLKKTADAALMKQELVTLRQETKLISSAWFSLNSRVEFKNVILQRKSEPPRGLLKIAREFSERSMAIRSR